MKRVRGGAGLGDAIYIRAIVEQMLRDNQEVTVCSDYPAVFEQLPGVKTAPFSRENIQVLAHYTLGKTSTTTTQWDDVQRSARVPAPLKITWTIKNQELVDAIRKDAAGRPVVLVHGGRTPMGRTDGFGAELLPEREPFEQVLDELKHCFRVRVGKGADLYPLTVDVDLNGGTTVTDLLDLGAACDGMVGQCSWVIPLAEVFDKPLLCVWSAAGLRSPTAYVKLITPEKVLHKSTSRWVIDDWTERNIRDMARVFMFGERPINAEASA